MKEYSSLVLRVGLALVILWFAVNQFINPEIWISLVPDFVPINHLYAIYLNAGFEIIISLALILGFYTRLFALLFGLHLIPIIISLGYGPSTARDFGLMMASFSLAISGSDYLSLDNKFRKLEN